MNKNRKKIIWFFIGILTLIIGVSIYLYIRERRIEIVSILLKDNVRRYLPHWHKEGNFWVTEMKTPNISEGINRVEGVVLHHTAYEGPGEIVAKDLCRPHNRVSCHVVIDKDGTRFVLAPPDSITWHAGHSKWGNEFKVNRFMIGIEFQGNTLEEPLTDAQIESAIDYLRPIIKKYGIQRKNVVTHEMVRDEYKKAFPKKKKVPRKVDITQEEYQRVLNALDTAGLFRESPLLSR